MSEPRADSEAEWPPVSEGSDRSLDVSRGLDLILPLATIGLMLGFAFASDVFLTFENLRGVAVQIAATVVITVPVSLLLMAGYVDLSVGSVAAIAAVVTGVLFGELPTLVAVAAGLGVGLAAGAFNGGLIAGLGMSPIVVTLGSLTAGRGLAQVIAPDPLFGFPASFTSFGNGTFLGVPYLVAVAAVVAVAGGVLLTRMPAGRHLLGVGVNPRAAYLVGIPVRQLVFWLYLASGFAAALGGVMLAARLSSAPSAALGAGLELTVLTAILLGGVPFTGGTGSVLRVCLGVWLLGVLANGLTLLNVGSEISLLFTGGVLVMAAALEIVRMRLADRSGRVR